MKRCPICNKPVGDEHEGAKVYHFACLQRQVQAHHKLRVMAKAKNDLLAKYPK